MEEAATHLVGHRLHHLSLGHCHLSPVKTLDPLSVVRVGGTSTSTRRAELPPPSGALDRRLPGLLGTAKVSAHMKTALEAKDRNVLGLNAPAEGLYFVEASY